MENINNIALDILNTIILEEQDRWKADSAIFKEYRHLQLDKRGSFGERLVHKILSTIYYRRLSLEYQDGDQGDWDIKFNGNKLEIKTISLDTHDRFQVEGIRKNGAYDYVIVIGVTPNSLCFKIFSKTDFNFNIEKCIDITGRQYGLCNRGKENTTKYATGTGYKLTLRWQDMIPLNSYNDFQLELEKFIKPQK